MTQTRLGSFVEAVINTSIGFIVSLVVWPLAAYLFELEYTSGQHFGIVAIFTVTSVAKGYVVRRYFNARLHNAAQVLAKRVTHNRR